jgi:hypothetical protein
MEEITVPPRGTRVEVQTQYLVPWMNQYARPTVGVVAHSNSWDKPGTFRLVGVNNAIHESVISLDHVVSLRILEESAIKDPHEGEDPKRVEVLGSKGDVYVVMLDGNKTSCTCPAGSNGRLCRHVRQARQEAG